MKQSSDQRPSPAQASPAQASPAQASPAQEASTAAGSNTSPSDDVPEGCEETGGDEVHEAVDVQPTFSPEALPAWDVPEADHPASAQTSSPVPRPGTASGPPASEGAAPATSDAADQRPGGGSAERLTPPPPVETGYELRLPTLTDVRVFGIQFSSWIVTITLGTFVAGILIGLIVASLVDIDQVVEAPGQLHPVDVQPIRPLAGGMIVDVLVETGDTVQVGQPLLQLDTADLENRRMQLRSQIASARIQLTQATYANRFTDEEQRLRSREAAARVEEARTNLRRQMVRHRRGADVSTFLQTYQPGTSIDLDQAVSGLDIAETKLALAEQAGRRARLDSLVAEQHREDIRRLQAEMAHVQRQISRAQVVAPSTGVVLNDQLETLVGRLIQRGDLILEIASLDTWQAHLFVGQSDVHLVQVGDSSKVEVDAFIEANELVTGRVTSVGAVPVGQGTYPGTMQPSSTSPRSRAATYRVVVELDPNELETLDPQKFRRGFTVRGQVITTSSSILEHLWRWGREKLNV